LPEVDRDARNVAHVVLENVKLDVSDRLDDLPVTNSRSTSAGQVFIGKFPTLNDNARGEFKDGISFQVRGASANCVVDFGLLSPIFAAIAVCALKQ
jgi:hypothetical protein